MAFQVRGEWTPGGRHLGAVWISAANEDLELMGEELGGGGSGLRGPPRKRPFDSRF